MNYLNVAIIAAAFAVALAFPALAQGMCTATQHCFGGTCHIVWTCI